MSKLLDLESFATHVEAATRQAGFAVEKREGAVLYVGLQSEALRCDLNQIYEVYQSSPHRLDDIVQMHLDALRSVPPTPPPPTEKEAAESLLPLLNRAEWQAQMQQQDVPPPVHRPFVAELVINYVLDMPHHRAYVNRDMLAKMMNSPGITFEVIHEYALKNLRRRTTRGSYETHGRGDKAMIVCQTQDGYAATRVLVPDLMAKWAKRIPSQMLIGLPNRDFLIAFSSRNPVHVAAIAGQVQQDAAERDHPLCADLLVWDDGQVREYRSAH